MEDIASASLAGELVSNADNLREKAEEHLDDGREAAAAELFASAGDKYSAAAKNATFDHVREEHERNARLCYRLADQLESGRTEEASGTSTTATDPETTGSRTREGEPGAERANGDGGDGGRIDEMITEDVGLDFDDYIGREELKDTIDRKVFSHAENPELDEEFGVEPANGFVLFGPPGSGKTYFVKCMAGEVDMPYVEIDITEMMSKYINESAQLVREVFEEIREHGPMMVCINELDAIAMSRDTDMTASEQKAINKVLTEVEELEGSRTIIVGTTNKPDELDKAVTRSGRFTDEIEVGIPDEELREKLIRNFMADRPLASSWDLDEAVYLTEGCTPADLDKICEEAGRIGRDHYLETGEKGITNQMFEDAMVDILG